MLLQGAGKGKALEFILKELREAGAYPEAGVQVRWQLRWPSLLDKAAATVAMGLYNAAVDK